MKVKIIETADGSQTLYIEELDEQYHSVNGAITESKYVYLEKGFLFHKNGKLVVFEVGFGTGLNALITALEALKLKKSTTFYSIEKYPVNKDVIQKINYGHLISEEAEKIFEKIHSCEWGKTVTITPYFKIHKIQADLTKYKFPDYPLFDVIYFDAFGPDKQPKMWTPEIFMKIYNHCSGNAVFVTYSAKGEVRRQLQQVGFEMERLPGPPGKIQMLRGIKNNLKL